MVVKRGDCRRSPRPGLPDTGRPACTGYPSQDRPRGARVRQHQNPECNLRHGSPPRHSLAVTKVRRGSIVYTDRFQIYDSLMFCGYRHLKVDHAAHFARGRVTINGLEGFWSWAKERLMKHHGISPRRFPLYLKEVEFRYNHRDRDIFTLVTSYLCDLVPNQA